MLVLQSSQPSLVLRRIDMDRTARRPRRTPIVLLGAIAATAYFAYHAQYGTHGLQARARLLERAARLDREVAGLEAVRRRLKRDVDALSTEPPSPGIVEEQARDVLGFARPGDIVIPDRR